VTDVLVPVAALVATAAAVRSTWSPCGLSMLSSITPFGERARRHSYRSTTAWFVAGAVVGGATTGAVAAGLAAAVRAAGVGTDARLVVALAAVAVAALSDLAPGGHHLPVHHRQVNERWLDQYRAWVYGAGFGWQIGCGLATYITTAAVYLTVVLAALTASPVAALAVVVGFGLVRGLAVLLSRRVTSPAALLAFHRRFAAAGPFAGRVVLATEAVAAGLLALGLAAPAGTAAVSVVTAVVGGAAVVAVVHRRAVTGWDATDGAVDRPAGEPAPAGPGPGPASVLAG
jgi:hypothetical protein